MQKTCTLNGKKYRAVPNTNSKSCENCAGVNEYDDIGKICAILPICHTHEEEYEARQFIIWVPVISRQKKTGVV